MGFGQMVDQCSDVPGDLSPCRRAVPMASYAMPRVVNRAFDPRGRQPDGVGPCGVAWRNAVGRPPAVWVRRIKFCVGVRRANQEVGPVVSSFSWFPCSVTSWRRRRHSRQRSRCGVGGTGTSTIAAAHCQTSPRFGCTQKCRGLLVVRVTATATSLVAEDSRCEAAKLVVAHTVSSRQLRLLTKCGRPSNTSTSSGAGRVHVAVRLAIAPAAARPQSRG